MIKSKEDYLHYLQADKFALGIDNKFSNTVKRIIIPNYIWKFQKSLRQAEYYKNCNDGLITKLIHIIAFRRYKQLSLKLGFTIPLNVFGPGLSIAHYGTIVVNGAVRVGVNCRIHTCVNIGASSGSKKAPTLGDNCYIAPGAKIYGDITLTNNIVIGANSVVNKSFNESNIAIAGSPAKKIGSYDIEKSILYSNEAILKNIKLDKKLNLEKMNEIIKKGNN